MSSLLLLLLLFTQRISQRLGTLEGVPDFDRFLRPVNLFLRVAACIDALQRLQWTAELHV
jgi:hypothetical protein